MVCLLVYAPKCSFVIKADTNGLHSSHAGPFKNGNCYFKGPVNELTGKEIIPGIISKASVGWIEFVSLVAIFVPGILLLFHFFNIVETFSPITWNRFEMFYVLFLLGIFLLNLLHLLSGEGYKL